jgi:hypothetical protein
MLLSYVSIMSVTRAALLTSLLLACGKPAEAPPPPAPQKPAPDHTADDAPVRLHRAELEAVLAKGPPWILSRIEMEEVLESGKFVGWRLRDLPYEWKGIDLKPGDVVTAVNTLPLETPDDFWAAWTTLSVASELKVSYLRDGEERVLSLPIDGSPDPELSKKLSDKPEPGERPQPPQRKKTVVIPSDDRPISDTVVDWSE